MYRIRTRLHTYEDTALRRHVPDVACAVLPITSLPSINIWTMLPRLFNIANTLFPTSIFLISDSGSQWYPSHHQKIARDPFVENHSPTAHYPLQQYGSIRVSINESRCYVSTADARHAGLTRTCLIWLEDRKIPITRVRLRLHVAHVMRPRESS